MARYFVTGATGFVGAEVAKQLRTRGHRVTVLARAPAKASLLARLGCDVHEGDILRPDTLRAGMAGADGVFHLAAWYKTGQPQARCASACSPIPGGSASRLVARSLHGAVPRAGGGPFRQADGPHP